MRRWGGLLVVLVLGMGGAKDALCQATGARASERTVDELVNHALANNPELQAARSELEAAQGSLLQAGLRPNPMLDVGWQRSVTGPDNNFMAGVTLPLDLNGRRAGRVGVAESERGVRAAQLAERERVLRAEVRLKAGEVLSARRNIEITAELLEANHKALSLLHSRVRRGALPRRGEAHQRHFSQRGRRGDGHPAGSQPQPGKHPGRPRRGPGGVETARCRGPYDAGKWSLRSSGTRPPSAPLRPMRQGCGGSRGRTSR